MKNVFVEDMGLEINRHISQNLARFCLLFYFIEGDYAFNNTYKNCVKNIYNLTMFEYRFIPATEMKVEVSLEQQAFISTKEDIKICCSYKNVLAYDIFLGEELIGFAMIEMVTKRTFFLWDYAIDLKHQNQGHGTAALLELIDLLKKEYGIKRITTTYIWGNEQAKRAYEKAGFLETDVVDEPDCHEVNMMKKLL